MVIVSITFPTLSEARSLSKKLVQTRLAACVNIYPVESFYRWRGKLVTAREAIAEAKTVKGKVPAIKRYIQKYHSDAVPAVIISRAVESLPSYRHWVGAETRIHARR